MPQNKDKEKTEDVLSSLDYMDSPEKGDQLMNIAIAIVRGDEEEYKKNVVAKKESLIKEDFAELSVHKHKLMTECLKYFYAKKTADRNAELHNKKYGDIIIKTSAGDNNKELELIKMVGYKYPEESLFSYVQNNLFERNIESIQDMKETDEPINTGDVIITKTDQYFIVNLDGAIMAMKTDKDNGIMLVGANRIPFPRDGYTYD